MTVLGLLVALLGTAGDPCEGLALGDGVVTTARRLAVSAPVPPADVACAGAIGRALKERGAVRSVTVVVRLPEALRAGGRGEQIGSAYAAALAAGGVPEARITTLVPAAREGEEDSVAITFTEKRGRHPVARIDEAAGDVKAGADEASLRPASKGETLLPRAWVTTGADSRAWLALADGSRVKLLADTALRLAELKLSDDLKRQVKLEVTRGEVEAEVKAGGEGASFQIDTGTGVAGVRGTAFRLGKDADGTRLETTRGVVELTHEGRTVTVKAGFGARAAPGQPPSEPLALLAAPVIEGPLRGRLFSDATFRWSSVAGASSYRVDLARDAEFTYELRRLEAPAAELPAAALKDLPPGRWFWRVSGLGGGFGGQTSKVYAFEWAP